MFRGRLVDPLDRAPWSELVPRYGSATTCWRRLRHWAESGVLLALWCAFLNKLNDRQKLRWNECFIDGSVALAKKRGAKIRPTKRERSGWYWSMGGYSLGAYLDAAASSAEVTLLENTLASQPIRASFEEAAHGVAVVAAIADQTVGSGGPLPAPLSAPVDRRADDRWRGNFRRLTVRYDRLLATYGGFFHLACALLTLRRVLK